MRSGTRWEAAEGLEREAEPWSISRESIYRGSKGQKRRRRSEDWSQVTEHGDEEDEGERGRMEEWAMAEE